MAEIFRIEGGYALGVHLDKQRVFLVNDNTPHAALAHAQLAHTSLNLYIQCVLVVNDSLMLVFFGVLVSHVMRVHLL